MERFDLNSARSVVGHNVNLHLKDGSVIINVLITEVERKNRGKRVTVYYTTPTQEDEKGSLKRNRVGRTADPPCVHGVDHV